MFISRFIIASICFGLVTSVSAQIKIGTKGKVKTLKESKIIGIVYKDTLFCTEEFNMYSFRSVNGVEIDTTIIFQEKEGITVNVTEDSMYMTVAKYMFRIDSTYTKTVRAYDKSVTGGRFYNKEKLISVVVPKYKDTVLTFHKPELKSIHTKRWAAPVGNGMPIAGGSLITAGVFAAATVNLIRGDKENVKAAELVTLGAAVFTSCFIIQLKWHRSYDFKSTKWTLR